MTPGIHLLHKPVGPTSFSLVQAQLEAARSHKDRKPPRLCHGGTLDPFASGLLLMLVEPATRLFDYLHDIPKTYHATVRWGVETDNGDPLGSVVSQGDASRLTEPLLDAALLPFMGWQEQVPPATSAKRIDGERAYEKVHRGEAVSLPPSRVYLHEARWLGHDLPGVSQLLLTVRGGFYVRALVRDLGRQLGCGAHVAALHRTAIGPWSDPGPGQQVAVSGADVMPWLPVAALSDQDVGDLRQKKPIACSKQSPGSWSLPSGFPQPVALVRGFHRGKFCFLLRDEGGKLSALAPLRQGL